MRRNNFTSASDRRWQRRYERIQQRREEELERRDRQGREEAYEAMKFHDIGIDSLIASSPTFTVEIQRPDEPNLNGTVISEEAWDAAWTRYLQRAANESRPQRHGGSEETRVPAPPQCEQKMMVFVLVFVLFGEFL